MKTDISKIYDELLAYCAREKFCGYDPFDGLNSRIFKATPLKYFSPARLVWLEAVKRSQRVNLRETLRIDKGVDPKGLALSALGELSRFRVTGSAIAAENARHLLSRLFDLRIKVSKPSDAISRTAFGYNFDWQSRAFFSPKRTPSIIPTAFAARAFSEAYLLFDDEIYLQMCNDVCEFILFDLNRSFEAKDEICFSYTPLDRSMIYHTSLLAGETLASIGAIVGNRAYRDFAAKSARFVIRRQKPNGSWTYGSQLRHAWVDNFHTAYVLLSLHRISDSIPALESEIRGSFKKGLEFWLKNFFLADGTPKYFDSSIYPIDIHSAAAAIVALCEFSGGDKRCLPLAEKVAAWTISNMRDREGFFYYQVKKDRTDKTSYMSWAQAWMMNALAQLIEKQKHF